MDDRWWVKTQCRLERSAAECRQAISCYLAKKSTAVDDWNVVASTISCRIIEAIYTGVYVPGWIAYTSNFGPLQGKNRAIELGVRRPDPVACHRLS